MSNERFEEFKRELEGVLLVRYRKKLGPVEMSSMRSAVRRLKEESAEQDFITIRNKYGIKETYKELKKEILQNIDKEQILNNEKQENCDIITQEDIIKLLQDKKTKVEGIYALAQFCLQEFDIITINDEVYIYNEGVYEPDGKKKLGAYTQKELKLDELITTHVFNEFCGYIKRATYTKMNGIREPPDKICLSNGILNLNNLTIEPHSSSIVFFNKLPVVYDSSIDCPRIKKFLSEVAHDDCLDLLQEISGYCLYKQYHIHKSFMFVGTGANGKSTFINLLRMFLGQENCSSIPLQQLENNRFALSPLFGKLVNMFADLSARALHETSIFKMLTGEDLIPAEKKGQDHFFFTNYAKLIFSCNQIPRSPDDSDAFFRRWVIVNFPNQFLDNEADSKLLEKLTTPEELSGFLNYAITGLKRLLKNGKFSNSKAIEQVREDYIRRSDSVAAFQIDCILIDSHEWIPKKELYTCYTDYCRKLNYPILPENTFHRQLQKLVRVEDYRPQLEVEGKKQRVLCWRGIKQTTPDKDVKENYNLTNKESNVEQDKVKNNPDKADKADTSVNEVNEVKVKNHLNDKEIETNKDSKDICFVPPSSCRECGLELPRELKDGLCPMCRGEPI